MDDAHLLLLIKGILIALLLIGIKYKYSDQKLYTYKPGKFIRKLEKDYPPEKETPLLVDQMLYIKRKNMNDHWSSSSKSQR